MASTSTYVIPGNQHWTPPAREADGSQRATSATAVASSDRDPKPHNFYSLAEELARIWLR